MPARGPGELSWLGQAALREGLHEAPEVRDRQDPASDAAVRRAEGFDPVAQHRLSVGGGLESDHQAAQECTDAVREGGLGAD